MEPFGAPKQNLRGMNKPKCIQCGNVARSRCPFQSCKGCCSRAQNPCHIHVLKQSSSTLPDKPPPSASPLPEQPSTDTHLKGASSLRLSSLRQLSSNVANNLRNKRPLSRKDAIVVNKWRFSKLREQIEGERDAENEAFDRYMQNVRLLEETLSVERAVDDTIKDRKQPGTAVEELQGHDTLISAMKVKLRCSRARSQHNLERSRTLVDTLLQDLQDRDKDDEEEALQQANGEDDSRVNRRKVLVLRAEKTAAVSDLLDRLMKARTDDDLKLCVEIKKKLYDAHANQDNTEQGCDAQVAEESEGTEVTLEPAQTSFFFSFPKPWVPLQIKQDDMSKIEAPLLALDVIQL